MPKEMNSNVCPTMSDRTSVGFRSSVDANHAAHGQAIVLELTNATVLEAIGLGRTGECGRNVPRTRPLLAGLCQTRSRRDRCDAGMPADPPKRA